MTNTVTIGGHAYDIASARALMDDDLCEAIHGTVDTDQEFVDAYLIAHAMQYRSEERRVGKECA